MSPEYEEFTAVSNEAETYVDVALTDLKVPYGSKSVEFAVWGNENGQNDLKWYNANKENERRYTARIAINTHKELGAYTIHAYCKNRTNDSYIIGASEFRIIKKATAAITFSEADGSKGTFKITISTVPTMSGIQELQVPVWSCLLYTSRCV